MVHDILHRPFTCPVGVRPAVQELGSLHVDPDRRPQASARMPSEQRVDTGPSPKTPFLNSGLACDSKAQQRQIPEVFGFPFLAADVGG